MVVTSNLHNLHSFGFVAYWDSAVSMIALWDMHTAHKCTLCVIVFFFTFIFYYFWATTVEISLRLMIMKSLYCLKSINAPNIRKDGSREKVLGLLVSLFWKIPT